MPGRLNTRVVVERLVPGDDGYGNAVNGWSWHLTTWGDMAEGNGKEAVEAGRLQSSRTAVITLRRTRATAGITAADRITARGAVWAIHRVGHVGNEGKLIEIHCETGVAT